MATLIIIGMLSYPVPRNHLTPAHMGGCTGGSPQEFIIVSRAIKNFPGALFIAGTYGYYIRTKKRIFKK